MINNKRDFIENELRQFKRKYWLTKLLQGILIFVGTGVVLFGIIAFVEFFSWLSVAQRTWLFWITLTVELTLFGLYIGWPILQLLVSGRALSDVKAAQYVGNALPGISDRLTNYLELKSTPETSDLIDASLNQKQVALSAYSFTKAIKFSSLKPFLLFLIPLGVLLLFVWSGNRWFMLAEGADRLVNYNKEYQRSLPFDLQILTDLQIDEGEDFPLRLSTTGHIIPEEITIESAYGQRILSRENVNQFQTVFTNVLRDVPFRIIYDGISSQEFLLKVNKRAIVGRISINVVPPAYTHIAPFTVENKRLLEVPQNSKLTVAYTFKNIEFLQSFRETSNRIDTVLLQVGDELTFSAAAQTSIYTKAGGDELSRTDITIRPDHRPDLDVSVDSTSDGIMLNINASDDYAITSATLLLGAEEEGETTLKLVHQGALLKTRVALSKRQLAVLSSATVKVADQLGSTVRTIDLLKFKEKKKSESELLGEAGSNIDEIQKEDDHEKNNLSKKEKNKELKSKTKKIEKAAKELAKKDSVLYDRFEKLSEEILKLAEDLDKDISETQEKIKKDKLEKKIAELEKEWMILKTLEKLKGLEDSLSKKNDAIEKKQMENLQKSAKELEETMKKDKEDDQVDWKKFDELKKQNDELKKEIEKSSAEKKEQEEDQKSDQKGNDKKGDKQPSKEEELKDEMKKNSESLRSQLEKMSDMMLIETTQKNVEMIRRLELRALKTSNTQEEIYRLTVGKQEIERKVSMTQKEVSLSANSILDSLSALTISDPKLAQVLMENQQKLELHLDAMQKTDLAEATQFVSNQRYLQFGLNDLAAILYDILKSENESLMKAKAGNKQCNNPKPGKGKKPSMSDKQKQLGEKMGKVGKKPKPGKGKPGQQSMSQSDILELIKGQEEIIEQMKEEGGDKSGDGKLAEEMNKQLDDLINLNLDKAIERNKSIEDKLITLEKSDNQKKEQEEKRQSKENVLDYDAIKNSIVNDYIKSNQRGSSIVNLPTLKNYFLGKWVIINQE